MRSARQPRSIRQGPGETPAQGAEICCQEGGVQENDQAALLLGRQRNREGSVRGLLHR